MFSIHHVALTVKDLDKSIEFYSLFGFKPITSPISIDENLKVVHLKKDNFILEIFSFERLKPHNKNELLKDLKKAGFRHIAFKVDDINKVLMKMKEYGLAKEDITVKKGKTGILYFFITDPDGNFVEIVQDNRELSV